MRDVSRLLTDEARHFVVIDPGGAVAIRHQCKLKQG